MEKTFPRRWVLKGIGATFLAGAFTPLIPLLAPPQQSPSPAPAGEEGRTFISQASKEFSPTENEIKEQMYGFSENMGHRIGNIVFDSSLDELGSETRALYLKAAGMTYYRLSDAWDGLKEINPNVTPVSNRIHELRIKHGRYGDAKNPARTTFIDQGDGSFDVEVMLGEHADVGSVIHELTHTALDSKNKDCSVHMLGETTSYLTTLLILADPQYGAASNLHFDVPRELFLSYFDEVIQTGGVQIEESTVVEGDKRRPSGAKKFFSSVMMDAIYEAWPSEGTVWSLMYGAAASLAKRTLVKLIDAPDLSFKKAFMSILAYYENGSGDQQVALPTGEDYFAQAMRDTQQAGEIGTDIPTNEILRLGVSPANTVFDIDANSDGVADGNAQILYSLGGALVPNANGQWDIRVITSIADTLQPFTLRYYENGVPTPAGIAAITRQTPYNTAFQCAYVQKLTGTINESQPRSTTVQFKDAVVGLSRTTEVTAPVAASGEKNSQDQALRAFGSRLAQIDPDTYEGLVIKREPPRYTHTGRSVISQSFALGTSPLRG